METNRRFFWKSVGLTLVTLKPCCILNIVLSTTSTGASLALWGHHLDDLLLWGVAVPLLVWSVWDFIRGIRASVRNRIPLNATLVSIKVIVLTLALGMTIANIAGVLPWQHHHHHTAFLFGGPFFF